MLKIQIEMPGILTTVQDQGRVGYMEYGVRTGGVMDQQSGRLANALAGNKASAAVLEMTLMGITAVLEGEGVVALTGADMGACLDGIPVERYCAIPVRGKSRLTMGMAKNGCRGYLAVSGGIDVAPVMGSRSTDVKCSLGGLEGRLLKAGDELHSGTDSAEAAETEILQKELLALPRPVKFDAAPTVRVVEGPQADWFSEEARSRFYESEYKVSGESDRMGMRLEGESVESLHGVDIVSDGIAFGSIQIPKNGKPIVMMADHQTIGGYAKLGTVCSFDLPKLAQLKPGDKVHFEKISIEKAQFLLQHPEEQERSSDLVFRSRGESTAQGRRHHFQKYNYYYRHGC